MAVFGFGTGFVLNATGNKLDKATIGHTGDTGSYRLRVNAMHLVTGITGGATVISANGVVIWSGTPTVSGTTIITGFAQPQELDDVTATTLGTNVVLVVFTS